MQSLAKLLFMRKLEAKIKAFESFKVIKDYLPNDNSNRQSLNCYLRQLRNQITDSTRVLDLGCGEGKSNYVFKKMAPKINWHGIDIEDSPEVRKRTHELDSILTFDGMNLPYSNKSFDLIYCNQVLEHVRYPDKLLSEAFRVLRPNGIFLGSVSYLEPYHSYSIFNFTPYGIVRVFADAGFKIEEIRPGSDASLLINRQLFYHSNIFRFLWNRNYFHIILNLIGKILRIGHCERNFLKIQFAGHLVFLSRRPENTDY